MDLVVALPSTRKIFDFIWVIIDHLKRSAHSIPVKTTLNVEQLAKVYVAFKEYLQALFLKKTQNSLCVSVRHCMQIFEWK